MKTSILLMGLLLSTSAFALNDGFSFTECSGSGSFEQQIAHYGGDYENAITVGTIPTGIIGLHIELTSDKDVDIRLYGQNNDKVVHWPHGLLPQSTQRSATYLGTDITYSGYNGTNGELGHEFITVDGTTQVAMTMKAFGYKAGLATVNYQWTGKEGCDNTGDGNFTQSISQDALTLVGEIPAGVPNVRVELTSDSDLDIQLYGTDGTVIVGWKPVGLLSGSRVSSLDYHGMHIEWSGYDGTNGNKGHEYIQITGTTTEALTMKVYGYEAGFAEVSYSWHETPVTPTPTPTPDVCIAVFDPVCGQKPSLPEPKSYQNMCKLLQDHAYYLYEGVCQASQAQYELTNNLALWQSHTIFDYTFLHNELNNTLTQPILIHVKNNTITEAFYQVIHEDSNIVPIEIFEDFQTINERFETIQNLINNTTDNFYVNYDPIYGYPARIEVYDANTSYTQYAHNLTIHQIPHQECITISELQNKVINGDDITDVNTSCITDMSNLFLHADEFNQPIGNWDVSNVTSMAFMFSGATIFNQDISSWDVSNVINMNDMFAQTNEFNQDISNWEVQQVNNMNGMFWEAKAFNQPIWKWNISFDTYMPIMFLNAISFAQNLSGWTVVKPELVEDFALGSLIPAQYLPTFVEIPY